MKRCVQLAKNGLGTANPNPLVGSVLVYKNIVIGEGWHYKAGQAHAEVHAIANAQTNAVTHEIQEREGISSIKKLISRATLYVSLEPCSHVGKTPPCADLIITKNIQNVVIGSIDPNPKVAGNGIQKLRAAGCNVTIGVLEKTCIELNKRFFTFHQQKRPYVFLKWAESADGFIAPLDTQRSTKKEPIWISNIYSRQLVHKLRTTEQAILVGTNTVTDDNPSLTAREWAGSNPWRVVIDRHLKLSNEASILDREANTIIITEKEKNDNNNLFYEKIDFSKDLAPQICNTLYRYEIQSLIIEGGKKTLQTFIDSQYWDEALVFRGNTNFDGGITVPKFQGTQVSKKVIKTDTLQQFKNNQN